MCRYCVFSGNFEFETGLLSVYTPFNSKIKQILQTSCLFMIYFLTTCNQTTHTPGRPHESKQAETAVENIQFQSSTRIRKSVGFNAREVIATRLRPDESGQAESAYQFYPDLCGRSLKPLLESGFKTMRFRCPDSLVSCRKADSCNKKYAVSKITGFVWTLPRYLRHHDFVFVYPVWIHHPHEY